MKKNSVEKFNFIEPATYEIKVQGKIPENFSSRLGGMQINVSPDKTHESTSILIGLIKDQSALSGILNTLYELRLPLIAVNKLE